MFMLSFCGWLAYKLDNWQFPLLVLIMLILVSAFILNVKY